MRILELVVQSYFTNEWSYGLQTLVFHWLEFPQLQADRHTVQVSVLVFMTRRIYADVWLTKRCSTSQIIVIEADMVPGMTPSTVLFHQVRNYRTLVQGSSRLRTFASVGADWHLQRL